MPFFNRISKPIEAIQFTPDNDAELRARGVQIKIEEGDYFLFNPSLRNGVGDWQALARDEWIRVDSVETDCYPIEEAYFATNFKEVSE
jgi:hypothetical protein